MLKVSMADRATARRKRQQQNSAKSAGSGRSVSGRYFMLLVLGILALGGVMTRVQFLDRSLWLDEAWVANSIRAASLRDAVYYDEWLQTTPPLFIALSRTVTEVFGTSNLAFRLLPAFFGILAIPLFAFIALRILKPGFAIVGMLLFISNPQLILYSQSLKQYSTDVFSTIALLIVGYLYLERRTDRWYYALLAGFVTCSFLSYPAMLFWPFLLYIAFVKTDLQYRTETEGIRNKLPQLVLVIVLGVSIFLINYLLFIAPNKNPALAEFFREGFYEWHSYLEFIGFYGTRFSSLAESFFFGRAGVLRVLTILIITVSLIHLWVSPIKMRRPGGLAMAVLLTAPIAAIMALNVIGVFPLPGFHHRLLLFVFPITALLFCLGLQFFASILARLIAPRVKTLTGVKALATTSVENVLGIFVAVMLAIPILVFFTTVGVGPIFAEDHEEIEPAIGYLAQRIEPDDVLYIHATMRQQLKLYGQTLPANKIVHGGIGAPCCPRNGYRDPRQESVEDLYREVSVLSKAAAGRRLWLVSTDRQLHWVHVQRNDVKLLERGLASGGCAKIEEARFKGVYIGRFGCQPQ
jgi:hypothetical protein